MWVNGEPLSYRVNSIFVLPGEGSTLTVGGEEKKREYALQTVLNVGHLGPNVWSWKAPREPGIYPVTIFQSNGNAAAQLNVFVMAPFSQLGSGYVNGYHIGN